MFVTSSTKAQPPGEVETLKSNLTLKNKAYPKANSSRCLGHWEFYCFVVHSGTIVCCRKVVTSSANGEHNIAYPLK